jgi:hypothetical protein
MSDWAEKVAVAEAAAEREQAAEAVAESKFDAVHALAEASADADHAQKSDEFRDWMAARRATDAAWGAWSVVMDARPRAS